MDLAGQHWSVTVKRTLSVLLKNLTASRRLMPAKQCWWKWCPATRSRMRNAMCGRNTRAAEDPSAATTLAMAGGGVLAATPAMAVMVVMAIDERTMAVFTGMIVTTGSAGTSAATSAETSAATNAATTEVTEDRNEGMTATGATTAAATKNDATTAAAMAAMAGDLIHIGTIEEMSGTDITMMLGSARLESLERLETEMVEMLEMVEMHGSERDGRATTRTATQKHHGGHAREVTTGAAMDATSAATNATTIGETIGATNATLPVTRREEETTGLQVATPWPLAAATRGIRVRRVVLRTDGARQPGRKPVRRWRKLRPRPVRRRSCVSRSRTRP